MPPDTLYPGANRPLVYVLQLQLNLAYPHFLAPLKLDGQFGAKTLERVQRFQRDHGLAANGIVGRETWDIFQDAERPAAFMIRREPIIHCGNCIAENAAYAAKLAAEASAAYSRVVADEPANTAVVNVFGKSAKLLQLTKSRRLATAKAAFKTSLNYDRIFLSDASGAENRPFTVAVPSQKWGGYMVIMNVGTLVPADDTLIHELVHAWQSQHHSDPTKFMRHCIACQALAVEVNIALGAFDFGVIRHDDFPMQYPFSAYAFDKRALITDYGGEQMAQAFEKNHGTVRAYLSSKPPGRDSMNEAALDDTDGKIGDLRDHNVMV